VTGTIERPPVRVFPPWQGEGDHRRVDFDRVNRHALANADAVIRGLLPDGRREGTEWVARNPQRPDRHLGSFKVNLTTGKWADFATDDRGGDLVSLAAFVGGLGQREAAIRLGLSLGVDPYV
jgi:hypothetical protein